MIFLYICPNVKRKNMEQVDKKTKRPATKQSKNLIIQMIEDKERIVQAIENGKSLSTLKGIKIVSPL